MTQIDKRIEWKTRYDAWKASGLSVSSWCRKQGLKVHQMYYWKQKFDRDEASFERGNSDTQWLTVDIEDESSTIPDQAQGPVFLHFDAISVEVRPGASMPLLSDIVHVLRNQC